MAVTSFLISPGLRDHVAEHWQSLLAARLANAWTVPPLQADKLSCAARVEAIQRVLEQIDGPVILVAHSAGVMMVAHWAQTHACAGQIKGALLATPADVESPFPAGYPTTEALAANGWLPIPRQPLPFPSILAASRNDPLASFERLQQLARNWDSELVDLGEVGHLNPAAGFGEWPLADALLRQLDR